MEGGRGGPKKREDEEEGNKGKKRGKCGREINS